ncbi:MAG: DNA polymerase Y family protein [Planctomycetota bacterium]|nr:DNA polymerase Y family protein [Planctomycetota bacterium]
MIVCIWFPNWPIQRLFHERPELRSRRVAIFRQHLKQQARIILAATQASVVGLPVAEVDGFHLEPHDAAADQQALQRLAVWCEQFSPIVGLEGTDSLLLDVTGLKRWFDAEQLRKELLRQRWQVKLGIGSTIGRSWGVAHYAEGVPLDADSIEAVSINALPIEALRLSAKAVQTLHELGIQTLSQLQCLPRDGLALRFPDEKDVPGVLTRLDQFNGLLSEQVTAYHAVPPIVVQRVLEYPLESHERIVFLISQLIEQVSCELKLRQQGALRLQLCLRCQADRAPSEVRLLVGLYQASASARHLTELVQLQLERQRLPGPVIELELAVLLIARLQARQQELFDDQHQRERQLAGFVDRTRCRVPLLRALLVADAQPEHAVRYEPFEQRSSKQRGKVTTSRSTSPLRPLLLEPRPVAINTIGLSHGAPVQFIWRGEQHRTVRSWGPERIQTGWWRGRYIRRDYYRVETASGMYWLFRSQQQWFLHGVFD